MDTERNRITDENRHSLRETELDQEFFVMKVRSYDDALAEAKKFNSGNPDIDFLDYAIKNKVKFIFTGWDYGKLRRAWVEITHYTCATSRTGRKTNIRVFLKHVYVGGDMKIGGFYVTNGLIWMSLKQFRDKQQPILEEYRHEGIRIMNDPRIPKQMPPQAVRYTKSQVA